MDKNINLLREYRDIVNAEIENIFKEFKYPDILADGMRYAILNGGKRLRPVLLLTMLELLGVNIKLGIPTAVAIEMIHSYSLVHDDLPSMDNDDFRRGKPSTHKKFGEAEAILIGDGLLSNSFFVLTDKNRGLLEDSQIVDIVMKTSDYSGIDGMVGGQFLDILNEDKDLDIETLDYIYKNKTGKLISLCVELASIIAKTSKEKAFQLAKYGQLIGLAFQIKDDILDIEGNFEETGKSSGNDEKLNKCTYPTVLGLERSKEILSQIIEDSKSIIVDIFGEEKARTLLQLTDAILYRTK